MDYFARCLTQDNNRVYGIRRDDTEIEIIADSEHWNGLFKDKGSSFYGLYDDEPRYTNLHIEKNKLKKYMREI